MLDGDLGFPAWVRVMHWFNFLFVTMLVAAGSRSFDDPETLLEQRQPARQRMDPLHLLSNCPRIGSGPRRKRRSRSPRGSRCRAVKTSSVWDATGTSRALWAGRSPGCSISCCSLRPTSGTARFQPPGQSCPTPGTRSSRTFPSVCRSQGLPRTPLHPITPFSR